MDEKLKEHEELIADLQERVEQLENEKTETAKKLESIAEIKNTLGAFAKAFKRIEHSSDDFYVPPGTWGGIEFGDE